MSDTDVALKDIESNFPELKVASIDYIGEGMDSKAFEVNGALIFRFPKTQGVGVQLKVEIRLLPKLRPTLTLRIPDFKYVGNQSNGLPFVGYEKIHGTELTKNLLDSFTNEDRGVIFKQIADLLQQIHAFPLDIAKQCGAKEHPFRGNVALDFQVLKHEVFPVLAEKEQQYIERLYSNYLSDSGMPNYTPTLIHADLSEEHILVDIETKRITGIIDFGDICIGDPDYDFMFPYEEYGEEYIRGILRYYPHDNHDLLFRKLDFYSSAEPPQVAWIAVHRKDNALLQKTLKQLSN